MVINWQEIITTVGGDAVLIAAAAWLIKALVANRLAIDVEKFKVEMKATADAEIERVKAFLNRASRVHERELEILGKLYRHLHDAQGLFQSMTRAGRFAGEIPAEQYAPKVNDTMKAAYEEFSNGRLFIPLAIVQLCEGFFKAAFQGQSDFAFSLEPNVNPAERSKFWDAAGTVAYEKLPEILQQIHDAARTEIGDANITRLRTSAGW